MEWDVPTKARNMKLDRVLTDSLYPGPTASKCPGLVSPMVPQNLKGITFPKFSLTLAYCTYPGSPTTGVIPLGYRAEMGILCPPVSNCTNLVPKKERKGRVGRGSLLSILAMNILSWISFSY